MKIHLIFTIILCSLFSYPTQAKDNNSRPRNFELPSNQAIDFNVKSINPTQTQKSAQQRMRVFEAIAQDLPWSAIALTKSGIIFQHTNTENEPDDGEEYRSQEMHLFTYFLLKESDRISGTPMRGLLGPFRYLRVTGLPKELDIQWEPNSDSENKTISATNLSDEARIRAGFPFPLLESYLTSNPTPLPNELRTNLRDQEILQLYNGDQQTRSLFKKDEMIFNRMIERIGDAQRRARLYEMMAEDLQWEAPIYLKAALVLNQTPSTIKRQGKKINQLQENHLFAFFLARQAFLKGEQTAAPLVVETLNTYLRVSHMPNSFQLGIQGKNPISICQIDPHISVELWGKYEFPFHLGRLSQATCPNAH